MNNYEKLFEYQVQDNIDQTTPLLTLRKKNIHKMPSVDFFYLTPLPTYFRVLIQGRHIIHRIKRFKGKFTKLYSSINKALQIIENKLPDNNLDMLTYGVIIKKDNKSLFQFPIILNITKPYYKKLKLSDNFNSYKKQLRNNDKIKKFLENKVINGTNYINAYEYNTYTIPTILYSDMALNNDVVITLSESSKRKESIIDKKAKFISSYIEDIIYSKDITKFTEEKVTIDKTMKYVNIPRIFKGYIDIFGKNDYMIFPSHVWFNNLELIEIDVDSIDE